MLQIQSISKNFDGTQALNSCSFEIQKNKITALIGPNGAGKTTLLDIISGIIDEDKGKIILETGNWKKPEIRNWKLEIRNGKVEITGMAPYQIANLGISRTFQLVELFKNLTIRDHLNMALNQNDGKLFYNTFRNWKLEIARPLRLAKQGERGNWELEIKKILDKLELDRPLETIVTDLSYGQRKLLDLAIALLKPHQLLLLDEPVEGVSPQIREKIKDILEELKRKGETILIIEHDIDFVTKIADWVVVLDNGEVLWQGKPEEIRQRPEIIEAYLGE